MKAIDKTFQRLHGELCWGLQFDRQLNLSMNFGRPSLSIIQPFKTKSDSEVFRRRAVTVRGEWWLWIYLCHWRITQDTHELATSSASFRRIDKAIRQLDGQALVSVEIHPETGATRFSFDLGGVLHCRRYERNSEGRLWILYTPGGYCLSIHGNGTFCHQRDTELEELFQPIKEGIRINQ